MPINNTLRPPSVSRNSLANCAHCSPGAWAASHSAASIRSRRSSRIIVLPIPSSKNRSHRPSRLPPTSPRASLLRRFRRKEYQSATHCEQTPPHGRQVHERSPRAHAAPSRHESNGPRAVLPWSSKLAGLPPFSRVLGRRIPQVEAFDPAVAAPLAPNTTLSRSSATAAAFRQPSTAALFPLYEIEHSRDARDPDATDRRLPVSDWLKLMGKTRHLLTPANTRVVAGIQAETDRRWARLKAMHEHPLL